VATGFRAWKNRRGKGGFRMFSVLTAEGGSHFRYQRRLFGGVIQFPQAADCVEKPPDVKYAYRMFWQGHQDDGKATERTGSSVLRLQP
jgi:hypothetical protein